MLCAAVEIGKNFGHGGTVEGVWVSHRPSWIGGVAAPKAQTGWLFKFDKRNPSIWNNHPGAARHPSYPGGAMASLWCCGRDDLHIDLFLRRFLHVNQLPLLLVLPQDFRIEVGKWFKIFPGKQTVIARRQPSK